MDLFDTGNNLLPYDGVVTYHERIMQPEISKHYLDQLLDTIEWKNDEAMIFGKHIVTKRKAAWYGDNGYDYTYSNITKTALSWTKELLVLKKITEEITGTTFNSCLLNLYHSGEEGMAWHSDDEKSLLRNAVIASFSFGAERKFSFRHKRTGQTISVSLADGSLLVMKGSTQANWLHRLPKTKKIKRPRVNLTFRTMTGNAS